MICRSLFRLFALFFFLLAPFLHAEKPLVIGMEMAYPPFEMTDPKGEPAGVSVDLGKALGKALNRPVRFENIPFAGLIPALKTGKVDCVISSMTATPERGQAVLFSEPYLKTGLCLLLSKSSLAQSVADLNRPDRIVAVKLGTTGHLYATQHLPKARVLVFDKESECVLEVAQGKADAFIYDQMSVYRHWKRNERTTRALLAPFQEEAWAIAVQKGNDALKKEIDAFLNRFRAEGGFEALGEKWLPGEKKAFQEQNIPFVF